MSCSYIGEINSIQIELSTKCNAQCPSCIRTDFKSLIHTKSFIPKNQEMPLETIHKILDSSWSKATLAHIEFCGTMDEPLAHSQFMEILSLVKKAYPDIKVSVHTNGSLRGPEYFAKLGKIVSSFGEGSNVRFGIDGMLDTHAIYRYRTDWNKIITNLKSYIDAGGSAVWQAILFPWNEHQAEEMKEYARELGCASFYLRPDRTFASTMTVNEITEIRNKDLPAKEWQGEGSQEDFKFVNANMNNDINCIYRDSRKMFFISWDSLVWPCCFWPNARYETTNKKDRLKASTEKKYGLGFNDLRQKCLDEILQSPLFQNDLISSWRSGRELKWRCVEKCSVNKKRKSDGKVDDKNHFLQESFF